MLLLEHYGVTDAGKVRKNNEDSLLVGEGRDETLFVVADGIGGFEAGEVASSIAVDVLKDVESSQSLEDAIREANRRILVAARGDERLSNMGTTVVAVRFGGTEEEPLAEVSHVGDSRVYLFRDGALRPLTEDHSLVAELVRSGDLTRAQASEHPQKNLITRALGAEDDIEVDTTVLPIKLDDRLILCSDGLTDMLPEPRMLELLASSPEGPERAARALVQAALDAGGLDNVTVVVVDIKGEDTLDEREHRSSGTQEMRAIAPPEIDRVASTRHRRGSSSRAARYRKGAASRRKRLERNLGMIIRVLAVMLVLVTAVTPLYLWSASRYFLGFDGGEVTIYRGLPPNYTMGLNLNEEVRRTGLVESDIQERYRSTIEKHRLYSSEEEIEEVVRDLESS
ncbi:MAG: Stp1/IreP family PP2C-type Ser/Thr phosphatase [Actinomycetota bacterium]|nr:Stp1/IreP family PP2C-type Ser/Thr phosphatase [Actinomycetota bacterium]